MTINDARRCGMPLNEIIEGSDIYEDMKASAISGDLKSILDLAMWNEIQGDINPENSIKYYETALALYKKATYIDDECFGQEAHDDLKSRIGR